MPSIHPTADIATTLATCLQIINDALVSGNPAANFGHTTPETALIAHCQPRKIGNHSRQTTFTARRMWIETMLGGKNNLQQRLCHQYSTTLFNKQYTQQVREWLHTWADYWNLSPEQQAAVGLPANFYCDNATIQWSTQQRERYATAYYLTNDWLDNPVEHYPLIVPRSIGIEQKPAEIMRCRACIASYLTEDRSTLPNNLRALIGLLNKLERTLSRTSHYAQWFKEWQVAVDNAIAGLAEPVKGIVFESYCGAIG